MKENFSIKEVILNILYSFISVALPTAVLQFIVQPVIAKYLGSESNGQYLTIMSLNYFLIGITSAVLNNVRLLQQQRYSKEKYKGDFNIFLGIYVIIILIAMPIGWIFYTKSFNVLEILLLLLVSYLYLYHDYICVEYRINLQYNKVLINNILMTLGYAFGVILFIMTKKWQIVFISAYTLPTIFDLFNTSFIKEPFTYTPLFRETLGKVSKLTCSNALGTAPAYCDKFVLYPILGGESVSIYNSASIVGKLLILVSAPLNSVFLSYIVRIKELKVKFTVKKGIIVVGILILAYFTCVIVGYPLISLLYPDWAIESYRYIPITVAGSLFMLISNLLNIIIIRFYNLTYQIIIEVFSLIAYFIATLAALYLWGLYGFCIAVAIVAFLKMIVMITVIFIKPIKNDMHIENK